MSGHPLISVIIPTHRRPEILALCLQHLAAQTIAKDLEVIVVSDGPDPATAALFQKPTNYSLLTTHYFEIPKAQQGRARNVGVEHAHASLVLFIGDDIFLEPDACACHLKAHADAFTLLSKKDKTPLSPSGGKGAGDRGLFGVLGYTTWDPSLEITPVMRWLEQSGWQFGYPMIEQYAHGFLPTRIQERFTYTSHISVPTEIARKFPFREDVSLYGWEDIEWGDHLKRAGIRLFYEPDAEALHYHHMTLEDSLRRAETLGRSLVAIAHVNLVFQWNLSLWRLSLQRLLALLPTMDGEHRRAFLRGVREATSN